MSRGEHAHDAEQVGFPRVSGDEPAVVVVSPRKGAFSPRERG